MTDAELVLKKLAFVETCLAELERLAKPELIADDVRERRLNIPIRDRSPVPDRNGTKRAYYG